MAEERLQRRLAAILSADVVGYSRLMGMDEARTLSRLNALRRELIGPTIAAHSGRIVKLMGDGTLVEFASAVDAVTCAVEIQRQLREHDAGSTKSRIGPSLHLVQYKRMLAFGGRAEVTRIPECVANDPKRKSRPQGDGVLFAEQVRHFIRVVPTSKQPEEVVRRDKKKGPE